MKPPPMIKFRDKMMPSKFLLMVGLLLLYLVHPIYPQEYQSIRPPGSIQNTNNPIIPKEKNVRYPTFQPTIISLHSHPTSISLSVDLSATKPSFAPTIQKSKKPSRSPTSWPTTSSPSLAVTELGSTKSKMIIEISSPGVYTPPDVIEGVTKVLMINVNGSIRILASEGKNIYLILPGHIHDPSNEIRIQVFEDGYDEIDLSYFPDYSRLSDLQHDSPPLRLLLSNRQTVILESHSSFDLHSKSFIFSDASSSSNAKKKANVRILIAAIIWTIVVACAAIGFVCFGEAATKENDKTGLLSPMNNRRKKNQSKKNDGAGKEEDAEEEGEEGNSRKKLVNYSQVEDFEVNDRDQQSDQDDDDDDDDEEEGQEVNADDKEESFEDYGCSDLSSISSFAEV